MWRVLTQFSSTNKHLHSMSWTVMNLSMGNLEIFRLLEKGFLWERLHWVVCKPSLHWIIHASLCNAKHVECHEHGEWGNIGFFHFKLLSCGISAPTTYNIKRKFATPINRLHKYPSQEITRAYFLINPDLHICKDLPFHWKYMQDNHFLIKGQRRKINKI